MVMGENEKNPNELESLADTEGKLKEEASKSKVCDYVYIINTNTDYLK